MNQNYKNKTWLKEKYQKEMLSCRKIGGLCGVSGKTIYLWLRKLDIPTRNLKEAMINRKKKNDMKEVLQEVFSSDLHNYDDLLDDLIESFKATPL